MRWTATFLLCALLAAFGPGTVGAEDDPPDGKRAVTVIVDIRDLDNLDALVERLRREAPDAQIHPADGHLHIQAPPEAFARIRVRLEEARREAAARETEGGRAADRLRAVDGRVLQPGPAASLVELRESIAALWAELAKLEDWLEARRDARR